MFYNRNVVPRSGELETQAHAVAQGIIDFPHSLCMHAIIVTKDNWILLTKRSRSVTYFPETWSCSIEEQVAERDFEGTQGNIAEAWAARMLNEELGLRDAETRFSEIRILAVFYETNIVNIGILALIYLEQDKSVLDAIIAARPRQDYEFTEWKYIKWAALPQELMKLTPTTIHRPVFGCSWQGLFTLAATNSESHSREQPHRRQSQRIFFTLHDPDHHDELRASWWMNRAGRPGRTHCEAKSV